MDHKVALKLLPIWVLAGFIHGEVAGMKCKNCQIEITAEDYFNCAFCEAIYCVHCLAQFTDHLVTHPQLLDPSNDSEGKDKSDETLYLTNDGTFKINDDGTFLINNGCEENQGIFNQERVKDKEQASDIVDYSASLLKIGGHGENTLDKLVLGIVTWNVAHMGQETNKNKAKVIGLKASVPKMNKNLGALEYMLNSFEAKLRHLREQELPEIKTKHDYFVKNNKLQENSNKLFVGVDDKKRRKIEQEQHNSQEKINDLLKQINELNNEIFIGEKYLDIFKDKFAFIENQVKDVAKETPEDSNNIRSNSNRSSNREASPFRAKKMQELIESISENFELYEKDENLHRMLVVNHVVSLFKNNDWLDIVILQELNEGVDNLYKRILEEKRLGLRFIKGPLLLSSNDESSINGEKISGQHEYYPMIIRKKSDISIEYERSFAIGTDGEVIKPIEKFGKNIILWNKNGSESSFRPIMVNVIKVARRYIHIGIVHTSPGAVKDQQQDREFDRTNEYEQLRLGIEKHVQKGQSWIIGGDYYLFDETSVYQYRRETAPDIADLIEIKFQQEYQNLIQSQIRYNMINSNILGKELFEKFNNRNIKSVDDKYAFLVLIYKNGYVNHNAQDKTGTVVQDKDFVRNLLKCTLKHRLPEHLKIAQPVSGTNWHGKKAHHNRLIDPIPQNSNERAKYYARARIADIFLHTEDWKKVRVGLIRPEGKVVAADTSGLTYSKYWSKISDHFPIGGRFSTQSGDREVDAIFVRSHQATEEIKHFKKIRDSVKQYRDLFFEKLESDIRNGKIQYQSPEEKNSMLINELNNLYCKNNSTKERIVALGNEIGKLIKELNKNIPNNFRTWEYLDGKMEEEEEYEDGDFESVPGIDQNIILNFNNNNNNNNNNNSSKKVRTNYNNMEGE